ncbi:C-type lectin domain family 2 member A-like isoform X1 [Cuculus canorus]|uniref:C-type lectin domain family 2 member A-like isoform X1 n=1 Tax=Cuculus canorus TaxID=55661 RepID=UPI0023AAA5F7|nr:C-type lectin domain family 2 member A-like isoform X1 [Cuculus canorus]XP_053908076.1 C-type lectin domain family 2 member A-like isoform X1 [Cuculus canorus]
MSFFVSVSVTPAKPRSPRWSLVPRFPVAARAEGSIRGFGSTADGGRCAQRRFHPQVHQGEEGPHRGHGARGSVASRHHRAGGEKCFYFVEDQRDWNRSRNSCRLLGAHLATIGTREELGFLSRYGGSSQHWVGLRRANVGPWKWLNGSVFNNSFNIRGDGLCAYIDADGIGSDRCSRMKPSICSHPQKHLAAIQKAPETLWNSS